MVCEVFIIELAQALWPNIGGTLSSHIALLAHYLWKEVMEEFNVDVYVHTKDDAHTSAGGENSDVRALDIQIHSLPYSPQIISPLYCAFERVMGLAGG